MVENLTICKLLFRKLLHIYVPDHVQINTEGAKIVFSHCICDILQTTFQRQDLFERDQHLARNLVLVDGKSLFHGFDCESDLILLKVKSARVSCEYLLNGCNLQGDLLNECFNDCVHEQRVGFDALLPRHEAYFHLLAQDFEELQVATASFLVDSVLYHIE